MSKAIEKALRSVPGITKVNLIYTHPASGCVLYWFDCSAPGRSVVAIQALGTLLFLMEGPKGKVFADPSRVTSMQFVAFDNSSLTQVSDDLGDLFGHHSLLGPKP